MEKSVFYFAYAHRYKSDLQNGKKLLPFLEQTLKYNADDGICAIELFPTDTLRYDDLDTGKRFRELMDETGVVCPCFSFGTPILYDPEEAVKILKQCVDLAKTVGSPFLHHTFHSSYVRGKLPEHKSIYNTVEDTFADVARQVAYYAGERDMQCIYEDQGYYMNTVERLGNLLNNIGLPNTGVCLDVGNSFYNNVRPEYYAGAFASKIKHVHIKDYMVKSDAESIESDWEYSITKVPLVPCLPGTGEVNFERIFDILLSAGYEGYYSLEHQGHRPSTSLEKADEMISRSFDNVEKIYNRSKIKLNK